MSEGENNDSGGYDVYCGVDVGKSEHLACALDAAGRKIHDQALRMKSTTW